MRTAICVGINKYPNPANNLHGCVNDALDWRKLLTEIGFEVETLLDTAATRERIKRALDDRIVYARPGDEIVFTYSGHGTYTVDMSGDEADGYDEALYVYDGLLIDDELRDILQQATPGVHITCIIDSCFSGTVTRKVVPADVKLLPRFVYPEWPKDIHLPPDLLMKPKKRFLAEADMVEILMSGCSDKEYSYDAYFNGRPNGAFSYYAIQNITQHYSFERWHGLIREELPSDRYPQTPQLEGSETNKNRIPFTSEYGPGPEPEPDQDEPEPWYLSWYAIAGYVATALIIIGIARGC